MTFRVSGKNLDIGEALRQHVVEKLEATVTRHVSGQVVVTREGPGYRSDCTLRLSSGISLHAEGRAHEPYLCFDQAAAEIETRLRRYKTRLKGHASAFAANARGKVASYLIEQPAEEAEEPAGGFNPIAVAEETEDLKSLSAASALAELDLSGAPVVVFQHAGSGRVDVVYRRRDGAIRWLDPQAPREPSRAA